MLVSICGASRGRRRVIVEVGAAEVIGREGRACERAHLARVGATDLVVEQVEEWIKVLEPVAGGD